ncbi:hydroxyacylglutathione hydrolase family protein [Pelodictyon luteolum]|uniref:Hydroxyacylglutathione hydrolase, putative n=1 Tax=Chlorobium luteolum (strain DSM 273 / BCRC 81028 / 2530) TaxID=319225 RepID=Q3B1E2_CHLL3|nr:hydroxyacylglutathione hydrolase family protein [Pelodictyon luteolum]ABB24839.1 hydroxyacylglutathione hydrolase, putative [Pelodictyon luteolum DSM 273]
MALLVEQFRTGGDRNFGYLAADEESRLAFIVDASYDPRSIVHAATARGYSVRYIFSTHSHQDHTCGNDLAGRLTGLEPLLYGSTCPLTGIRVLDGACFPLGAHELALIHTPGHTPDSICLYSGGSLFTGDTLFVGKVGGTATDDDARSEYDSLHKKLLTLPPETTLWPGHDYGLRPVSDIGTERMTNPFLMRADVAGFIELKRNWAAYKKEHGIA